MRPARRRGVVMEAIHLEYIAETQCRKLRLDVLRLVLEYPQLGTTDDRGIASEEVFRWLITSPPEPLPRRFKYDDADFKPQWAATREAAREAVAEIRAKAKAEEEASRVEARYRYARDSAGNIYAPEDANGHRRLLPHHESEKLKCFPGTGLQIRLPSDFRVYLPIDFGGALGIKLAFGADHSSGEQSSNVNLGGVFDAAGHVRGDGGKFLDGHDEVSVGCVATPTMTQAEGAGNQPSAGLPGEARR